MFGLLQLQGFLSSFSEVHLRISVGQRGLFIPRADISIESVADESLFSLWQMFPAHKCSYISIMLQDEPNTVSPVCHLLHLV